MQHIAIQLHWLTPLFASPDRVAFVGFSHGAHCVAPWGPRAGRRIVVAVAAAATAAGFVLLGSRNGIILGPRKMIRRFPSFGVSGSRFRGCRCALLGVVLLVAALLACDAHLLQSTGVGLSYHVAHVTRPLWDTWEGQINYVPLVNIGPTLPGCFRFGGDGYWQENGTYVAFPNVDPTEGETTRRLSWASVSPAPRRHRLIDTFLFNGEFDLLAIRLQELGPFVDFVVIVEGELTFRGKDKTTQVSQRDIDLPVAESSFWTAMRRRGVAIDIVKNKTIHVLFTKEKVAALLAGRDPTQKEHRFLIEMTTRFMTRLSLERPPVALRDGDLVFASDIDEIPRRATAHILARCVLPKRVFPLVIGSRNHAYSFEFEDHEEWRRLSVARFSAAGPLQPQASLDSVIEYRQANNMKRVDVYLVADGGWHCSWCFRYISDFDTKIASYSHSEHDKVKYRDPARIQERICDGRDLFDRLAESKTFAGVLQTMTENGRLVRRTTLDAPSLVLEQAAVFHHLLPGGCKRGPFDPLL